MSVKLTFTLLSVTLATIDLNLETPNPVIKPLDTGIKRISTFWTRHLFA